MGWVFFVLGFLGVLHLANAIHPVRRPVILFGPSFFGSWLTLELLPQHMFNGIVMIIVGLALGAADTTQGLVGLVLIGVAVVGFGALWRITQRTRLIIRGAFGDLDPGDEAPSFPRSHIYFPFLMTRRRGVRRRRNIVFGKAGGRVLKLDVYEPTAPAPPGERRPVIVQIHGGGWVFGDKREQGIPLLNHLAANGWVGFNVNYRLSPFATWPDHLIDCKQAIAYIREHADEYGIDPSFIAVTGGSAGGHLASMVALTGDDLSLQPGFEEADTSVQAGVPFYGVYDLTDRLGAWMPDTVTQFIEPWIMKKFLADEPEAFAAASPVDRVHAGAPPMVVIPGSRDTLAPVEYARMLVERLKGVSNEPVLYAEMVGAQHAFDVFPSTRTAATIEGVERFLHLLWTKHRQGTEPTETEVAEELVDEPSNA